MSLGFRQVRLFISSTFRDMNVERDYLVRLIFPRLADYCAKRRLEFVPIDLRWGIPEEDSRNGLVLSACLDEVDNSRPFFIGILGSRYGWQPEESDLNSLNSSLSEIRQWLCEKVALRRSITEMEIEYAALRNMDSPYAAFFIRDDTVDVPEEFCEPAGSDAEKKLKALKKRICEQDRYPVNVYTTPDKLGDMIYRCVVEMIEKEYPETSNDEIDSVLGTHRYTLEANSHSFISTDGIFQLVDGHIQKNTGIIFIGGYNGTEILHTLPVLIKYLDNKYDNVFYFDFNSIPTDSLPMEAFLKWTEYAFYPPLVGEWWYLGIDNCSLLSIEEASELVEWINSRKVGAHIAVSASKNSPIYDAMSWNVPSFGIININPMNEEDRELFIDNYTRFYGKRLTKEQIKKLSTQKHASLAPYLQLVCQELVNHGDFDTLGNRIDFFSEKLDNGFIMLPLIGETKKILAPHKLLPAFAKATTVISIIDGGISENDIIKICDISQAEWSTVKPYVMRFCTRSGSNIDLIYPGWNMQVLHTWDTPFRCAIAYRIARFYIERCIGEHPYRAAFTKLLAPLFNFMLLPYDDAGLEDKFDDLFDDVHAICISPDIAKLIPNSQFLPLWKLLSRNHKHPLMINTPPKKWHGKHPDELNHREAIVYYQRLADIADGIGQMKEASWAHEMVAKYKSLCGDEDDALSNALAKLSLGKSKEALDILDKFEKAIKKRGFLGFGGDYKCSASTLLRFAIIRAKTYISVSQYKKAAESLVEGLKKFSPAEESHEILQIEAVGLLRYVFVEGALDKKYLEFSKINEQMLYKLPVDSYARCLYNKSNMLISYRGGRYKDAEVYAEIYEKRVKFSLGAGITNWPVFITTLESTEHLQSRIFHDYMFTLSYGKHNENILSTSGRIGHLPPLAFERRLPNDVKPEETDLDYRRHLVEEAEAFTKRIIYIEEKMYLENGMNMPDSQRSERMAKVKEYAGSLGVNYPFS